MRWHGAFRWYIELVAFVLFIVNEKFTALSFSEWFYYSKWCFYFLCTARCVSLPFSFHRVVHERNLCSLSNLHFLLKSCRFHNNKPYYHLTGTYAYIRSQPCATEKERKIAEVNVDSAVITFQHRIEMTAFMHVENKFSSFEIFTGSLFTHIQTTKSTLTHGRSHSMPYGNIYQRAQKRHLSIRWIHWWKWIHFDLIYAHTIHEKALFFLFFSVSLADIIQIFAMFIFIWSA